MKAPSVREGSKENGTAAKIPPVSIAVRRRGRPSRIIPHRYKVLPSHNSSKPRVSLCSYFDVAVGVASHRRENQIIPA
jgi:hypothetical protein